MAATQRVQIPISFLTESTVYAPLTSTGSAQQQTIMIPVPNAPVSVYNRLANGQPGSPATIYADSTTSTQLSTIATDAGGNVPGFVVEGSYLVTAGATTVNGQVYSGATIAWDAVRGDGVENIYPGAVVSGSIANGAVGTAQLAATIQQALVPPGTLLEFAGNAAPTGYLLCDGSAVSRTTYAALFAVIGSTYGSGNGSTTFNLPNFAGRVSMMPTGVAPYTLGQSGGARGHTHSVPSLSVPSLSIPAMIVNASSIPSLSIPGHFHSLSANGGAQFYITNQGGTVYLAWTNQAFPTITVNTEEIVGATFANIGTTVHLPGVPLMGNTDTSSTLFTNPSSTSGTSTQGGYVTGTGATGTGTTGTADQAYLAVNKIIKY